MFPNATICLFNSIPSGVTIDLIAADTSLLIMWSLSSQARWLQGTTIPVLWSRMPLRNISFSGFEISGLLLIGHFVADTSCSRATTSPVAAIQAAMLFYRCGVEVLNKMVLVVQNFRISSSYWQWIEQIRVLDVKQGPFIECCTVAVNLRPEFCLHLNQL